jgi:hypothetical protein
MERESGILVECEAMSELKIQYAYKDDKLYNVNNPEIKTGDKCYWVDCGKKYEVYPAKGEKQRAHFRCMPGVVIDANRAFHKDCQYYLQETKRIELENEIIEASEVLLEHEAANRIKQEIPNYSMIPDCLFLDDQGNIMCILEVWYTHKKSPEDIEKIKQYKIITFELKYETDYQKHTSIDGLYLGTQPRINRATEFVYQQQQDIERINREIREKDKRKHELRELEQEFYALVKEQILNYEKRI